MRNDAVVHNAIAIISSGYSLLESLCLTTGAHVCCISVKWSPNNHTNHKIEKQYDQNAYVQYPSNVHNSTRSFSSSLLSSKKKKEREKRLLRSSAPAFDCSEAEPMIACELKPIFRIVGPAHSSMCSVQVFCRLLGSVCIHKTACCGL